LVASVAIAAIVAFVLATQVARKLYLERSASALQPTYERRYAENNARLARTDKARVVLIGDSRVAQWAPRPTAPPQFELVWRGVSGETTAQLKYRYRQDTSGIGAAVIVLQSGINDVVAGSALGRGAEAAESAFANIRDMIESSTQKGVTVVLLTVVPPATPPLARRLVWSDSVYAQVAALNNRLRSLARPGVWVLDAERLLCAGSERLPRALARDTLHFREPAYRRLNDELNRTLQDEVHVVQ
jgi:lysophospholipase L1-like esterase